MGLSFNLSGKLCGKGNGLGGDCTDWTVSSSPHLAV